MVFPTQVRYFLNIDAGCLNHTGIVMREMQRATAGLSKSTAPAAQSGGALFVHYFWVVLNAYGHMHLCVKVGVAAQASRKLAAEK